MKNEHVIGAIVIAFVLGLLIGRAGVSPSTDTSKVYEYIFTGAPAGVAGAPTGATPSGPVDAARTLGLSGSPSKGVATAKVSFIESSDFQ